jgi:hypothetical protein
MPAEDLNAAAVTAAVAGAVGGLARVLVTLQGGGRRPFLLVLDFGLGGMLGIVAAGFAIWWDHSLRDMGWPILIVAAAAGCAGAIGTRLLDLVVDAAKRKLG